MAQSIGTDQIKKLKELVNADAPDNPDEPAIEIYMDDLDGENVSMKVFSADEFDSREYRLFVLKRDWDILVGGVYYDDEFGEDQEKCFCELIENTFKLLLPGAESDSLPKDEIDVILLMHEFEIQPAVIPDERERGELEAAQTITEALRIQAVRGWGKIDETISDKYLQVRKSFRLEEDQRDAHEALYIVDMENVNLSELAQQFQHPEDFDIKKKER